MVTITPNLFKGSSFNIIFELGANSIKKESLGFFAGLGIKFTRSFYIGGGYTYQKIKILEEGLNVGDILSSQDEFKTTTTFKDGFYLHITFYKEIKK